MKFITVQRDVMHGQCKGALARIQVRYTSIILFSGLMPGWAGSRIGIFSPRKTQDGYECTGFYFFPWLAPDIAVCRLPRRYRMLGLLSFRFDRERPARKDKS